MISYKSKLYLERAKKHKTVCRSCSFINPKLLEKLPRKFCIKCGKEQLYCSKKVLLRALESKTMCRTCAIDIGGKVSGKLHKGQKRDPKIGKKISQTKNKQDHTEANKKREKTNLEKYGSLFSIGFCNHMGSLKPQILIGDPELSLKVIENISNFLGVNYVTS